MMQYLFTGCILSKRKNRSPLASIGGKHFATRECLILQKLYPQKFSKFKEEAQICCCFEWRARSLPMGTCHVCRTSVEFQVHQSLLQIVSGIINLRSFFFPYVRCKTCLMYSMQVSIEGSYVLSSFWDQRRSRLHCANFMHWTRIGSQRIGRDCILQSYCFLQFTQVQSKFSLASINSHQ